MSDRIETAADWFTRLNEAAPPEKPALARGFREWIEQDPRHAEAFANPAAVRCAVNQDYARPEDPVRPGDEVAFFPPVTGG